MLKKAFNQFLKLSCSAAMAVLLFTVSVSAGSISLFNAYEHKMPAALTPKDGE